MSPIYTSHQPAFRRIFFLEETFFIFHNLFSQNLYTRHSTDRQVRSVHAVKHPRSRCATIPRLPVTAYAERLDPRHILTHTVQIILSSNLDRTGCITEEEEVAVSIRLRTHSVSYPRNKSSSITCLIFNSTD